MQTANHIPFPPLIQSVDSWGPEQNQPQLTAQSEHLCLTPNNNHTDLWATRLKDQGRRDINTLGWVHELCPLSMYSDGHFHKIPGYCIILERWEGIMIC